LCEYYFDEDRAVAYKINSPVTSYLNDEKDQKPKAILVQANVKITNYRKEKIRRILSEVYPVDKYDLESAKKSFTSTMIYNLVKSARKISQDEYNQIKAQVER